MRLVSRAAILGLLVSALGAQSPDSLIGLTRVTPIVNQRNHPACVQMPFCNPPGFPAAPVQPYAGGTAFDPIRNGVWISEGFMLAEAAAGTCNYLCPPAPAPLVSPNAVVTGLEMLETLNQVWMLDSLGNLYRLAYSCPPNVIAVCNVGLPLTATNATGGLAADEKNRLVFYSYTDWVAGVNTIRIANLNNPCQPFQTFTVGPCPGTAFRGCTGLGVDACRQVLYLTDGVTTIGWSYTVMPGPVVAFGAQSCCTIPPPLPGATFIGLAVRSGGATPLGNPCANGICPACPMTHTLRNSPNLGNASFGLDLTGAPLGTLAWCVIGGGPCSPPGLIVPPLCGPLFSVPVLGTIGPVVLPPGGGCGGSTTFNLALPMIPSLCGAVISSQCAVFCSGGGLIGTSLSNCLSWRLQSN